MGTRYSAAIATIFIEAEIVLELIKGKNDPRFDDLRRRAEAAIARKARYKNYERSSC